MGQPLEGPPSVTHFLQQGLTSKFYNLDNQHHTPGTKCLNTRTCGRSVPACWGFNGSLSAEGEMTEVARGGLEEKPQGSIRTPLWSLHLPDDGLVGGVLLKS